MRRSLRERGLHIDKGHHFFYGGSIMNPHPAEYSRDAARRVAWLPAMLVLVALVACGDRPPSPEPAKPPRPETLTGMAGYVITAEMKLPARPALPPPGMM